MKKVFSLFVTVVFISILIGCGDKKTEEKDYTGTYIGWSWKDEDEGVALDDATQKIQTIITLDKHGKITDSEMYFWKKSGDYWYTRQDGTAKISADLSITPEVATPGSSYEKGISMFKIHTHDMMSFYAVEVALDGTVGLLITDPSTRYQFEVLLPNDYDFNTKVKDVTVNGTPGGFIPTVRTSSSGIFKPETWSDLDDKHIFNITGYNHVMTSFGVFEDLTEESTMQELLGAVEVTFKDGKPEEKEISYCYHSLGGWAGNYDAITKFLKGKNATSLTSLVDWSVPRWNEAINENNYFGIDVPVGATKTAQNSIDTIAGATVRMSRESTSYQRALVEAKILTEEDIIKGRF